MDENCNRGARVVRGGSWLINARYCRSAFRDANEPGFRGERLGFRLVVLGVSERNENMKKISKIVNGVEFVFVEIPEGRFKMGSPEDEEGRWDDEGPQHEVEVKAFSMGETPVTQAQWEAVMGNNPSRFKGLNRPVECVSWNDCQEFCRKLNELVPGLDARLPTEAEWEYAARAGTTGPRYGELDEIAWYSGNSDSQTHPVREKKPNAFGLYDMLGNVWEWCADAWKDYPEPQETCRDKVGECVDRLQDELRRLKDSL